MTELDPKGLEAAEASFRKGDFNQVPWAWLLEGAITAYLSAQDSVPSSASVHPLPRTSGGNGWTLDPELLTEITAKVDSKGWYGEMEVVEIIALEIETRILSNIDRTQDSVPVSEGWQDIETAPKIYNLPLLAHSTANGEFDIIRWTKANDGYEDHFEGAGYGGIPISFITHWCPIPAALTKGDTE